MTTAQFTAGMFWAIRFAGHYLFRGPLSEAITDHIIDSVAAGHYVPPA